MARGFIVIIGVITAFARASQISIDHASRLAVSNRNQQTFRISIKFESLIQCGVKCAAFARNREDKSQLCYKRMGRKLCSCRIYKGHPKKRTRGRFSVYWCSAGKIINFEHCFNRFMQGKTLPWTEYPPDYSLIEDRILKKMVFNNLYLL